MSKIDNKIKQSSSNIGFLGWLFLVLFILKLNPGGHISTDVVNWSWWWVTAPLWFPLGIVLLVLLLWGISAILAGISGRD